MLGFAPIGTQKSHICGHDSANFVSIDMEFYTRGC